MISGTYDRYAKVEATKQSTHNTVAPVLLCNTRAEQIPNTEIFARTIPLFPKTVIPEYREEFRVCTKYVNMNDPTPSPSAPPTLHEAFAREIDVNNSLTGRDKVLDPTEKKRIEHTAEYVNHFRMSSAPTKNVWNNKTKRKEIYPVVIRK